SSKRRPALVLTHDLEDDIVLSRITSKPRESDTDARLMDWKISKLLFPSTVCVAKLATLSNKLVEGKMGELTEADKREVLKSLISFINSLRK
ncbi:MAG TPA: type II toxin-antitoxin system PemK/MazF family toxin, partial [Candidatus Kapabacteria bacterium]